MQCLRHEASSSSSLHLESTESTDMGLGGDQAGLAQEGAVGFVAKEQEMCHSGWVGLGHPVMGCGGGVEEQLGELGALGQVKGAVEKKVWDVLSWGVAVGAVGGRACGSSKCGGAVEVVVEYAGGAEPVARWWGSEGWVEAAAMPCSVACVTYQDRVSRGAGVVVAVVAGGIAVTLLFGRFAVAGGVGGEPVSAATEAGEDAAVAVGDGVVGKVGLRGEGEGRAQGAVVGALAVAVRSVRLWERLLVCYEGGPVDCRPAFKRCGFDSAGLEGCEFVNCGAGGADGGEVVAEGAEAGGGAGGFEGQGFL